MLNALENNVETKDLSVDSEWVKTFSGCRDQISNMTLKTETRLIVRNEAEILIPRTMREEIVNILHLTPIGDVAMLRQASGKIFCRIWGKTRLGCFDVTAILS